MEMSIGRCAAAGVTITASIASAQIIDHNALVDITGVEIRCTGPLPPIICSFDDQRRDSFANPLPSGQAQGVVAADGYRYSANGIVETSGLIAGSVPSGSTLGEVFNIFQAGQSILLDGYIRNLAGGLPAPKNTMFFQRFEGELISLDVGLSLEFWIADSGMSVFELRDLDIPLGGLAGSIEIIDGQASMETWVPSPPQETEWHFDADLSAVEGTAKLRYLDDPAFGEVLGAIDLDTPDPNIPLGTTEAQSTFTTTTSLGIPGPGGEEATVYVTSPARNLADPDNQSLYRGLGLALYPRLKPEYPGSFFGQWTMIWDIYIPQESWDAAEYVVALVEDSDNNDESADMFIRNPAFNAGGVIGYAAEPGEYLATSAIAPGRWMRLAFTCEHMQTSTGRIYVDGALIGETNTDWLYNNADPTDPHYADGEAIDPADWSAWGEFPNPWALSSGNALGSSGPSPISSTLNLFADLQGRSESVYVANMYFVDTILTTTQVAALGGANASGIVFATPTCPADLTGEGDVNTNDFFQFLAYYQAQDPRADFAPGGGINTNDFFAFLAAYQAGC